MVVSGPETTMKTYAETESILPMIADALKYPLESEDTLETMLIGSILVIASFLILPIFVLTGYLVRAIQHASDGRELPRFEDFGGLFVDGVKLTGVFLVYIVAFVFAALVTLLVQEFNELAALALFWAVLVPFYFGFLYSMGAVAYRFSRRRRMRDALQIRRVVRTALSLRYLAVFLLVAVVGPIIFTIFQVALMLTIIGILLIPAALLYEYLVFSSLLAEIEGETARSSV